MEEKTLSSKKKIYLWKQILSVLKKLPKWYKSTLLKDKNGKKKEKIYISKIPSKLGI